MNSDESAAAEAESIRTAYARREASVEPDRSLATRPGNVLALAEREQVFDSALSQRGIPSLTDLTILEVGCGTGGELSRVVERGAIPSRLSGIDLRPDAIEQARARVPGVNLATGDASRLPYSDGAFDLVYQATALSSMPSRAMRAQVAAEMRRVARPGGLIVSYDFAWNPRNR